MDKIRALAEVIVGNALHKGFLPTLFFVESRSDLADHLKTGCRIPAPCGREWKYRITGQTAFDDDDSGTTVSTVNMDELTDERIDEFCSRSMDMASVKIERFEDNQLSALVVIALYPI